MLSHLVGGPSSSRGLLDLSRRVARRLLDRARRFTPSSRRWRRALRERDQEFDQRTGLDTGGCIEPGDLGVSSANRRFAVAYVASSPEEFRRALSAVSIDHRRFVFIDFGSGKGRVVLLATHYPFKKVMGVEFSPLLHEVAQRNLATYDGVRRSGPVELVCGDAAVFSLPDEPLACYFYNPFQPEVMSAVLANIRDSFERRPRPIYLFYTNPVHESVLAGESFLEKVACGNLFAVYRARGVA